MMRLVALLAIPIALLAPIRAQAQQARGCDTFKWPVEHERAAMNAANLPVVASGAHAPLGAAFVLALSPAGNAALPKPPERPAKAADSFAGYVAFPTAEGGLYQVVLSQTAWIDLVAEGAYLKPVAFSSAPDCRGVHKIVRFQLAHAPLILQVSDARDRSITVMVERPAPQ
jgi:hypothetical protein